MRRNLKETKVAKSRFDEQKLHIRLNLSTSRGLVNGVFKKTEEGTPQGGNISPILSNIMLNELDKEQEKRGLQFVRYADDCVIFTKSKKSAERVMENITRFIETKLRLKVNKNKSK